MNSSGRAIFFAATLGQFLSKVISVQVILVKIKIHCCLMLIQMRGAGKIKHWNVIKDFTKINNVQCCLPQLITAYRTDYTAVLCDALLHSCISVYWIHYFATQLCHTVANSQLQFLVPYSLPHINQINKANNILHNTILSTYKRNAATNNNVHHVLSGTSHVCSSYV